MKRPEWKLECRENGSTFLCPLFCLWVAFGDYDPHRDLMHVWGFTVGWRRTPDWKPGKMLFGRYHQQTFSIGGWRYQEHRV